MIELLNLFVVTPTLSAEDFLVLPWQEILCSHLSEKQSVKFSVQSLQVNTLRTGDADLRF